MTEHFPKLTVEAPFWCGKCQKKTPHRIDSGRKGPCLDCVERLTVEHAQAEIDRRRAAKVAQKQLNFFAET